MTPILLFEPSYRRLDARIAQHAAQLDLLLMQPDGVITRNGAPVPVDEARPEIGWLNTDLFGAPVGRDYMVALLKSPALRWVQSAAAGFEKPIFAEIVRRGAILTTNHSHSIGISEYVLSTVLDHFQRGPDRRKAQAEHRWAPTPYREVAGSNWLIIGFGSIGQDVALRARAFGATVVGVRRSASVHPLADVTVSPEQIATFLPEADVVVMSLPLSFGSVDMVDAKFLAAMKAASVFVNVGRGGLVDEAALLEALDRGRPERAILDVFRTEPLQPDSRFWQHPRVTLTPHASPMGSGLSARSDALFLDNLGRFLNGETLVNAVSASEVLAGSDLNIQQ